MVDHVQRLDAGCASASAAHEPFLLARGPSPEGSIFRPHNCRQTNAGAVRGSQPFFERVEAEAEKGTGAKKKNSLGQSALESIVEAKRQS